MSSRVICRFREIFGFLHASVDLCVRSQCAVNAPTVFPQYAQHAHMLTTPVYYRFQKSIISIPFVRKTPLFHDFFDF